MGWKLEDINDPALRRRLIAASAAAPGLARPCAQLQKREAPVPREAADRPAKAKDHGRHDGRVPRTVRCTFHISDRRLRDLDGMTTTVLDCLVRAGAIPDDNRFEVGRLEAQGADCAPGMERVEVEILSRETVLPIVG
jgi:hypothetical protein